MDSNDFERFISEISAFCSDNCIIEQYSDYYGYLIKGINGIRKIVKKYCNDTELKLFEKHVKKIEKIYRCFLKGNIQSASTLMRNYFYANNFNDNLIINLDEEKFFRCRDTVNSEKPFADEMFHIPFSLRHKTRNFRFSISGFPCLYLADTIECCIKETNIAEESAIVAAFTLEDSVRCYDLTLECFEISDVNLYLKKVLIVFASSFQIRNSEDESAGGKSASFISFYVVPQMLTASIASKNDVVRCIRYKSTIDTNGVNYVFIPQMNYLKSKQEYDKELQNKFKITRISNQ